MATFSWAVRRLRVFLAMGRPPLEIVAYSSGPSFPFRLKQDSRGEQEPGFSGLEGTRRQDRQELGRSDLNPQRRKRAQAVTATVPALPKATEVRIRGLRPH